MCDAGPASLRLLPGQARGFLKSMFFHCTKSALVVLKPGAGESLSSEARVLSKGSLLSVCRLLRKRISLLFHLSCLIQNMSLPLLCE